MAKTEPPGRHHSSTGSPYELAFELLSQTSCQALACPNRFGAFSDTGQANHWSARKRGTFRNVLFQPRGSWPYVWASLRDYHIKSGRRRSPAAKLRYVRNPWIIQAESEPPGRLPPAPGSQTRQSHSSPRNLSLARVGWSFHRLVAESHTIPFVLTESQALIW